MSAAPEPSPTHRLTPAAAEFLSGLRASGFRGWSTMGIEEARAATLGMKAFAGSEEPVARVEPIVISSGGAAIQAQLYLPYSTKPLPTMVYMHGGGWMVGNHLCVDPIVRALANRSGCAILSVDYRLAPEHKYPAGLNDVQNAISWVRKTATEWGLDAERIAVGGDSSGANLAAAVCLVCRDEGGPSPIFQLLVYPALDGNYLKTSYSLFGDGSLSALSTADVMWFHNQYIRSPEDLKLPYVSPLMAESLADLPPALLIGAEFDPLIDDGSEYARRLEKAKVPVERRLYPGMFHGFWRMRGVFPEAQQALNLAGDRMRRAMAP